MPDDLPEPRLALARSAAGTADVSEWSELFSALSDPNRLRILLAIHRAPGINVSDLASATGMTDNATSHALNSLRLRGLVIASATGGNGSGISVTTRSTNCCTGSAPPTPRCTPSTEHGTSAFPRPTHPALTSTAPGRSEQSGNPVQPGEPPSRPIGVRVDAVEQVRFRRPRRHRQHPVDDLERRRRHIAHQQDFRCPTRRPVPARAVHRPAPVRRPARPRNPPPMRPPLQAAGRRDLQRPPHSAERRDFDHRDVGGAGQRHPCGIGGQPDRLVGGDRHGDPAADRGQFGRSRRTVARRTAARRRRRPARRRRSRPRRPTRRRWRRPGSRRPDPGRPERPRPARSRRRARRVNSPLSATLTLAVRQPDAATSACARSGDTTGTVVFTSTRVAYRLAASPAVRPPRAEPARARTAGRCSCGTARTRPTRPARPAALLRET